METAGSNSLMPIIVAIIGSQGLIVAALVLLAYRVGRMPSREESNALHNEVTTNKVELKEEIADTKLELKGDIADTRLEVLKAKAELRQEIADAKAELRQEIADAKAELRQEIANTKQELEAKIDAAKDEVLREIRRSHQQMMLALVNHTHNANGQAMFTHPPETEPAPVPADD